MFHLVTTPVDVTLNHIKRSDIPEMDIYGTERAIVSIVVEPLSHMDQVYYKSYVFGMLSGIAFGSRKAAFSSSSGTIKVRLDQQSGLYMTNGSYDGTEYPYNAADITIVGNVYVYNKGVSGIMVPKTINYTISDAPWDNDLTVNNALLLYTRRELLRVFGEQYWNLYDHPIGGTGPELFLYVYPKIVLMQPKVLDTAPNVITVYNTTTVYYPGNEVYNSGFFYKCIAQTSGTFDPIKWEQEV